MDGFRSLFLSPSSHSRFLGNAFLGLFLLYSKKFGGGEDVSSSIKDAIFSQLVPTNSVPRSAASAPLQLTPPPSPRSLASARRVAWIGLGRGSRPPGAAPPARGKRRLPSRRPGCTRRRGLRGLRSPTGPLQGLTAS